MTHVARVVLLYAAAGLLALMLLAVAALIVWTAACGVHDGIRRLRLRRRGWRFKPGGPINPLGPVTFVMKGWYDTADPVDQAYNDQPAEIRPCPGGCDGVPTPYADSDDPCIICGGTGNVPVLDVDQLMTEIRHATARYRNGQDI